MPTTDTPAIGDGVVTIEVPEKESYIMAGLEDSFRDRLLADRDRHSTNATTFEKVLEMKYASDSGFRDATAARIVLEAGSGRTRGETNGPGNTAAAGHGGTTP
jgi:hypothetical protein